MLKILNKITPAAVSDVITAKQGSDDVVAQAKSLKGKHTVEDALRATARFCHVLDAESPYYDREFHSLTKEAKEVTDFFNSRSETDPAQWSAHEKVEGTKLGRSIFNALNNDAELQDRIRQHEKAEAEKALDMEAMVAEQDRKLREYERQVLIEDTADLPIEERIRIRMDAAMQDRDLVSDQIMQMSPGSVEELPAALKKVVSSMGWDEGTPESARALDKQSKRNRTQMAVDYLERKKEAHRKALARGIQRQR